MKTEDIIETMHDILDYYQENVEDEFDDGIYQVSFNMRVDSTADELSIDKFDIVNIIKRVK